LNDLEAAAEGEATKPEANALEEAVLAETGNPLANEGTT
jgi:hypothetical protein